ncbi:uncharacterized protein LOC123267104 [Cotesia glomerata]|uniref:Centrosome-associated FAM110 C-terminal domain-containing protein n=1 Tax=Cotesia glomerata TaxID=32391 RepID=A0AAV7HQH0_COTGL|nr:uncharacterized protein LOC123267104 [Cotesia glomerata]XP_044587545.1 uncharacterized protein LOC123267104 [Cotesia glomerata]KAH0534315.1 hypothetical protein KQX54_003014 [Cotesia glomerata]
MMTAMARLPCKTSGSNEYQQHHQRQSSASGNLFAGNTARTNFWDIQTRQSNPTYVRSQHRQIDHTGKRKSAVELLQESKAFYVKSEIVLDRKQELKNSGHLQVAASTAAGAPPRLLRKCNTLTCNIPSQGSSQSATSGPCCWSNCQDNVLLSPQRTLPPALPPKSPRLICSLPQRRAISGPPSSNGGDQLQTKLRRLLVNTDSKENVFFSSDNPTLLSPIGHEHSNTLDVRLKFGRSNSHSSGKTTQRKLNISPPADTTCHKSLPDLHTSVRRRSSLSPRASIKSQRSGSKTTSLTTSHHHLTPDCETSSDYSEHSFKRDSSCYRSSRHIRRSMGSGGCDASSVLSSGGRTQKSSGSSKLSHGANARDSGGSSGHCTHRSEPPPRIQDCWSHVRRDSGASTQHSNEHPRSRRGSYINIHTTTVIRTYSPGSESSDSQTDYSPTCNSRFSDGWKENRNRTILRSKSDISDRYYRENPLLHQRKPRINPPRSLTELENFFDRLGLDTENYEQITVPGSNASSPVFFESVSSVDSALGLHPWTGNNQSSNGTGQNWPGGGNATGNCLTAQDDTSQRVSDPPSIVERNARIIKWLCQCRKVQFGYT